MLPQNRKYIALYSERSNGDFDLLTIYPAAGSAAAKLETPEGMHQVFQFHGKKAGVVMTAELSMDSFLDFVQKDLMKDFADEGEAIFAYRSIEAGEFQFHRVGDTPTNYKVSGSFGPISTLRPVIDLQAEPKARPPAPTLSVHRFADANVVLEHQTGATRPLSTGLNVTLRYDGRRRKEADSLTPTHAILNYADDAGDDDETVIGLGFEERTLVDYDGVFDLPAEVAGMLKAHGFSFDDGMISEAQADRVDACKREVLAASQAARSAPVLEIGDQVQVVRFGPDDAEASLEYVGMTGIVAKLITDDHGANESDPFVSVLLSNGKRDAFWSEELATIAKANDNSILSVAAHEADLDAAFRIVQNYLGIMPGDVAAPVVTPPISTEWPKASLSERATTLRQYLGLERHRNAADAALPESKSATSGAVKK